MNQKITKICKDIVKKYENDKNVLGIILFGSALKKDFDEISDVDFFIITKDKNKVSRINTVSKNTKVDILFNTIDDLKKFTINERKSTWRNTSYMLAGGEIIFTRAREIKPIIKQAKDNIKLKTSHVKNEILMHKNSINDFYDDIKRSCKKMIS